MPSTPRRQAALAPRPTPPAARVAWYAVLAAVVLVPLATTLGIARAWGLYALTDDPYHTPKLLALVALAAIATVAWAVDAIGRERALRVGPALVPLGAFAALVAVSTVASPDVGTSFFGASSLMTGALAWLACLWLGVLAAQYVTGSGRLVQLSRAVAVSGAAVAAVALLQSVGLDVLGTRMQEGYQWMVLQGMATTGNPNYTGALLVLPLAVAFALALFEDRPAWRWAMAASAVLVAAALFNTLTRAAWLGAVAAVLAVLLLAPGTRQALRRRLTAAGAALVGVVALGVAVLTPALIAGRFSGLGGGLDAFTAGRLTLWGDVVRVIGAHPLLGTGADRLGVAAYPIQSDVLFEGSSRLVMQDPHSLPLLLAAIFGVPAALTFIALVVLAVRAGFAGLRVGSGPAATRTLYAGWVAGLIGLAVTSLLSVTTITLIFVIFLALLVVLAPTLKRPEGRFWPTAAIAGLACAVLLVGLWGTWMGVRASNHATLARRADTEYHLKEAIRLTPWDSRQITQYLFLKIGAMKPTLAGEDAAAKKLAAELDAEIRVHRVDFPDELFFYRARVELYRVSMGTPGYQADKHLAAVDEALKRFPDDPEFLKLRQEALSAAS